MFVHDVMTRQPATVTADAHLKDVAIVLADHHVSVLPVIDAHGRICGVVSEADLIRDSVPVDARAHLLPLQRIARPAVLVSEVMTSPAITVHESTDVAEVAELMTSRSLKSLPVVDDAHGVVGMVSRSDLVRVRARSDDQLEQDVEALLASIGHRDWQVGVRDGVVDIDGPSTTLDRSIAEVAAQTVAGVVAVEVR
jgi:CBS-domain-containing membrane protein